MPNSPGRDRRKGIGFGGQQPIRRVNQHRLTYGLTDHPRVARAGAPKIIVTRDLELTRELDTRAVFFEKGRIVADGDLEEIVERFAWGSAVSRGWVSKTAG